MAAIAQGHPGWRFTKRAGNGSSVRAVANTPLMRGNELVVLIALNATFLAAIGALVGAPTGTVKTRMFYARRQLQDLLAAAGVAAA